MSNLVEIKELGKCYGKKKVMNNLSLSLESGRIVGILGPNGSGKSTLIKMMAGVLKPTSGQIIINGYPVGVNTKKIVSYLPERTYLNPSMKVKEAVDYFADFYEDFSKQKALDMLEKFGINEQDKIKSLSKGTREKVQIVLVMSREAKLYLLDEPMGEFIIGEEPEIIKLQPDELLIVPAGTLCGMQTSNGIVYTEIICTGKDINMNANVKTNEVFALKNLISYEEGSIANMDVVSTPDMKYVLMAFDEGTGLTPHRAPGNAIVFALEGKATIGYEGKDYELSEGECFRFEKNGLHSVTANGKFKMALLLVLE